jgi:hypothetical protein
MEQTGLASQKMDEIIARGRDKTAAVVRRIQEEVPDDRIVAVRALEFDVAEAGALRLGIAGSDYSVHPNALGQLAQRAGIPAQYLRGLLVPDVVETARDGTARVVEQNGWRRDLAREILSRHHTNSQHRALVRSVRSDVRAVLSDRFRRLDVRPLFEAFAGACQEIGAIPVDGTSSDVRISVQAILPTVHEPVTGEPVVLGLDWTNSDFGKAPYSIRMFAMRLVCLNGMIGRSEMSQRHLGGRLDDAFEWSQQTLAADTRAMRLATTDVVKGVLGPARVDAYLGTLAEAAARETSFANAIRSVSKELTKGERERAEMAFESPDVVNLPKGASVWRASNALSWIANADGVDPERRLELQELAGKILPVAA